MPVHVYNDKIDKKGKAMGHWWIEIAATGATIAVADEDRSPLTASLSTNFYVWGLDLSGTLQGAGGIGGLLATIRPDPANSLQPTTYLYTYDGNGNVSELLNPKLAIENRQFIVAHYEYSPFGETILATGPLAKENKFRFSTKYFDAETGLYYYGYRYYSPSLGRWLSRDPIQEKGGYNLYAFSLNSPIYSIDVFGVSEFRKWLAQVLVQITILLSGYNGPSPPPGPEPEPPTGPPMVIVVSNNASGSGCLSEAPATTIITSWSSSAAAATATVAGIVYVTVMYFTPVGRAIQAASFLIQIELNGGSAFCCPDA